MQPAQHECHACCLLMAEMVEIQPVLRKKKKKYLGLRKHFCELTNTVAVFLVGLTIVVVIPELRGQLLCELPLKPDCLMGQAPHPHQQLFVTRHRQSHQLTISCTSSAHLHLQPTGVTSSRPCDNTNEQQTSWAIITSKARRSRLRILKNGSFTPNLRLLLSD